MIASLIDLNSLYAPYDIRRRNSNYRLAQATFLLSQLGCTTFLYFRSLNAALIKDTSASRLISRGSSHPPIYCMSRAVNSIRALGASGLKGQEAILLYGVRCHVPPLGNDQVYNWKVIIFREYKKGAVNSSGTILFKAVLPRTLQIPPQHIDYSYFSAKQSRTHCPSALQPLSN